MSRVIAIGDIHGCCKTFTYLLIKKLNITRKDKIYCLGDYIDRGPDSKGVVDFILNLRNLNFQIHTLRGNHEDLMINSIKDETYNKRWLQNGGDTTLRSFNIQSYNELSISYKHFFTRTKFYILKNGVCFVHAGLNFTNENIFQDKTAMLWQRNTITQFQNAHFNKLIHGHSPKSIKSIYSNINSKAINIDGGCVFNNHEHLGNLVAFNISENKIIVTKNIE